MTGPALSALLHSRDMHRSLDEPSGAARSSNRKHPMEPPKISGLSAPSGTLTGPPPALMALDEIGMTLWPGQRRHTMYRDDAIATRLNEVLSWLATEPVSAEQYEHLAAALERLGDLLPAQRWPRTHRALDPIRELCIDSRRAGVAEPDEGFEVDESANFGSDPLDDIKALAGPRRVIRGLSSGRVIAGSAAVARVGAGLVIRDRSDAGVEGICALGTDGAPVLAFISERYIAVATHDTECSLEGTWDRCQQDLSRTGESYRGAIFVNPKSLERARRSWLVHDCKQEARQEYPRAPVQEVRRLARRRFAQRLCAQELQAEKDRYTREANDFARRHGLACCEVEADSLLVTRSATCCELVECIEDGPYFDRRTEDPGPSPRAVACNSIRDRETGECVADRAAIAEIGEGMVVRSTSDDSIDGIWTWVAPAAVKVLCFASDRHIAVYSTAGNSTPEVLLNSCQALAATGEAYRGTIAIAPGAFAEHRKQELLDECLPESLQADPSAAGPDDRAAAAERYERQGCEEKLRREVEAHRQGALDFAREHCLDYLELRADAVLLDRTGRIVNFPRPTVDQHR